MKSIQATRAHNELQHVLREFNQAREHLEQVVGELGLPERAGALPSAGLELAELDRRLRASRARIAELAGSVFENVIANQEL